MAELSSQLLFISFILYLVATLFFGGAIRQKKGLDESQNQKKGKLSGKIGFSITIIGFILHVGFFITRWIAGGYAPVSNMFEFITFFSMMLIGAFIIIYSLYKFNALGVFTLPITVILLAYANAFSTEITPLIPSLQSNFLFMHVMTTAAGQAILAISFVSGLIYLIRNIDQSQRTQKVFWLEFIMYVVTLVLGFVMITSVFGILNHQQAFEYVNENGEVVKEEYSLPALVIREDFIPITDDGMKPIIKTPDYIDAGQLNTLIWSLLSGSLLYGILRLILRKRISAVIQPLLRRLNNDLVDEISYRSVLIGFPVFTLGALIFGMIWAHYAWARFWAWDPKEVWALITWFFYAAFLHLRLSRGWHGEKSAWLAVIGFGIIMFNLIFVNLVIAGLHSYAA